MTTHIARGVLKFESPWWFLKCTGITASRDADGIGMLSCWSEETKETRMTVAHGVPMKGADMEWVTE